MFIIAEPMNKSNRLVNHLATSWNTCSSHCLSIGTVTSPVNKLLNVNGRLWCSIQGIIKVLDVETLTVRKTFFLPIQELIK